ncbi:MAG: MBL fold metallo-hydrolase [Proteobacteria bacterium]|nr:MBL fold metallo-hydrolase [Pseudomonadota bacterium]
MNTVTPSVHPDLAAHQDSMTARIYTLAGHIHCAFGYSVVNCTLIEGEDSCILVDTMTSMDTAEVAAAEFKKITDKPIKTIIFTHFHADHVSGTNAFVSNEDIASGAVEIIGQEELADHVMRDVGLIAPILGRRAMYQFGMRLPISSEGTVGAGLGPPQRPGRRTFVTPTTTFEKLYEGETGGIRFEVHLIPSETEDQCAVWLPDEKVLLSADAIYESFPNVYALRGTKFRNPMIWAQGVDRLREFGADILIPHHGRPVEGAEKISDLMVDYRDAIQFVHDQTIRYMNKGYRPDEIKEVVEMPEHLRDHPWLGEFYGSYKHSIPAIYAGYIGWYQGDPIELDPTPWQEKASRYVALMGGRDKLLETARAAMADDAQWAAELLTWLVRADLDDTEARELKAQALRAWAYVQKNATWRNWGLTAALELEDNLDMPGGGMVLGSPDQVAGFPLEAILQVMTVRLIAEQSWDTHVRVAFETTDSNESCALEVRRGVCQFFATAPAERDATMTFDRAFLLKWVFGQTTFEDAIEAGDVKIDGEVSVVSDLLAKFEPFNQATSINVAMR